MAVVQTQFDSLTVFDLQSRDSCAQLSVSTGTRDWHMKRIDLSFPYRNQNMSVHSFDDIKVNTNTCFDVIVFVLI